MVALEIHLRGDLDRAWSAYTIARGSAQSSEPESSAATSESGRKIDQLSVRVKLGGRVDLVPLRMIEGVEHFQAQLEETLRFASQVERLEHRDVPIVETGPA